MWQRLFIQLPKDAEYFEEPQLIQKSLYGTDIAAKSWNTDLTDWLIKNEQIKFSQSEVDSSLFIYRNEEKSEYLFLIIYTDDCLYFGSSESVEKEFENAIQKRFKLELQGWSHWFLGTRLYREEDGIIY